MALAGVLLAEVIRAPETAADFTLAQWDLLVRQARRALMLGTLGFLLEDAGLEGRAPEAARVHLAWGMTFARRHVAQTRWELRCLRQALASAGVPVVVLKGGAYVAAGLPLARGRLFSDLDIMVGRERLEEVVEALKRAGWRHVLLDAYDDHYYRTWMHELPPMIHARRQTNLDVHHRILPLTARHLPDPETMIAAAVPLPSQAPLHVLGPLDMVLHAAAHLLSEGELGHGFRDLCDLDRLIRDRLVSDSIWAALLERAARLDLSRPLYYALRYCARMLGTPVPAEVLRASASAGEPPLVPLMDGLFERALLPDHASCADPLTPLARFALYLRGHYLRMPMRLLLPHLGRKALRALRREEALVR